jgi:predicted O-methyltransferase YrrM
MHDERLPKVLRKYAGWVPAYHNIVEVGSWLGASAQHLLDGSSENVKVYLYDRWRATAQEVEKAHLQGEYRIAAGDHYEDIVKENLSEYEGRVFLHKTTDVRHSIYSAREPIGLYVDDASKNQIDEVLPLFETRFVWGQTIIVLMDYSEPKADQLRAYADRQDDWMFIEKRFGAAVYRYG